MRRFVLIVVAVLSGSAFSADPSPETVERLFPLEVGNTWTYRVRDQDDRFVVRVAGREMVGPETCFRLEGRLKDKVVASEHVAFLKVGLCRFRAEHEDIVPPVCVLRIPSGKVEGWRASFAVNGRTANANFSATTGEVTVPAGKFKGVRVESWIGEGPGRTRTIAWYADGVGLVRQSIEEGKRPPIILELEKFEAAKSD